MYMVDQLRRNQSELFGRAEDLLWKLSMELEPYLAVFRVPDVLEFRITRGLSVAELVELERYFRGVNGIVPGSGGYPNSLKQRDP
jgi:hypothetical protein